MKNRIIIAGLIAILGILIAIGPITFIPVCGYGSSTNTEMKMENMQTDNGEMEEERELDSGSHMACYYTARAEMGIGTLLFVLGILLLLLKKKQYRIGISIASVLLGIYVILIPTFLIGVCSSNKMGCRILTLPSLVVFGSAVTIISLMNIIDLLRDKAERKDEI